MSPMLYSPGNSTVRNWPPNISRWRQQPMKVNVSGFDGPVARATRQELERRGHTVGENGATCAIFFPGSPEALERLAADRNIDRLVLRSSAFAYGSNTKNPGLLTEDRISLLPEHAPEQRWLQMESLAARHSNSAAMRFANVLHR